MTSRLRGRTFAGLTSASLLLSLALVISGRAPTLQAATEQIQLTAEPAARAEKSG